MLLGKLYRPADDGCLQLISSSTPITEGNEYNQGRESLDVDMDAWDDTVDLNSMSMENQEASVSMDKLLFGADQEGDYTTLPVGFDMTGLPLESPSTDMSQTPGMSWSPSTQSTGQTTRSQSLSDNPSAPPASCTLSIAEIHALHDNRGILNNPLAHLGPILDFSGDASITPRGTISSQYLTQSFPNAAPAPASTSSSVTSTAYSTPTNMSGTPSLHTSPVPRRTSRPVSLKPAAQADEESAAKRPKRNSKPPPAPAPAPAPASTPANKAKGRANANAKSQALKMQWKKSGHNAIEKKYRANLNDKIDCLRKRLPGAGRDGEGNGEQGSDDDNSGDSDRQNDNGSGSSRLAKPKTSAQSSSTAQKDGKAAVLMRAVEYIKELEERNRNFENEIEAMMARIDEFEELVGEGISARK